MPELKLPAVFSAPQSEIKGRFIAPYVTFAHPKRKDEWDKIVNKYKQVDEGDMYLITQKDIVKLDQPKVCFIAGKQYWARTNAGGEVLEVVYEERPKPFKEHVEAVLLLLLDRVVPVNVQFRSVRCPAAKKLSDTLAECQTPEWALKGEEYAVTTKMPQAFTRFYGVLKFGEKRVGADSGLPYRPLSAHVSPTGAFEFKLLQEFMTDPDAQKVMQDAAQRYEFRISEIAKKAAK